MKERSSARAEFSAEATRQEMRSAITTVVHLAPDTSRKVALRFAAMVLGLPYDRVKRFFYGEARSIAAHEADQVRAYIQAAEKLIEARVAYEKTRDEFVATHPRLARLAPVPVDTPAIQEARETVAAAQKRQV